MKDWTQYTSHERAQMEAAYAKALEYMSRHDWPQAFEWLNIVSDFERAARKLQEAGRE